MTKDSFVAEVTFNEWGWLKNLFTFIIWLVISSSTVSFVQTLFLHIWLTSKLIIHLLSRGCLVQRFNRATGLTDKSNSAINASKLLRTQLSIHLIHIVNPGKWWKDCAKLNCDIFLYFIYQNSSMIQKAPSNQSQSHIEGLQRYVKTIKLYLCIPGRPPYHCSFNGICITDPNSSTMKNLNLSIRSLICCLTSLMTSSMQHISLLYVFIFFTKVYFMMEPIVSDKFFLSWDSKYAEEA